MKNFYKLDETSRLNAIFGELFDKTNKDIMSAARHGVSNAVNALKLRAESNLRSGGFNYSTSRQYGVGLIEGLNAYMYHGTATGFVTVLGDTRNNDGTWRLRFFEVGAQRKKRGTIKDRRFLGNAASSLGSDAAAYIQAAIQQKIDELNSEN